MLLYLTALTVAFLIDSTLAQCPYSVCTCAGTVVDCSNKGLTAVPPRINTGATYTTLLLIGNKITTLNSSSLFPVRLDTIDLTDNPIATITSDALFPISQSLKSIKFRNSNFAALPTALEILDSLESLDIESDPMTFTDTTVAKLSETVKSLRLVNLGLTAWPAWLARFFFLQELDLSGNKINNPPVDTFNVWRSSLTQLTLANTGLSVITGLSGLQKLRSLDVSSNTISNTVQLSFDLIPFGNTLQFLDVSRNALTTEPRLAELTVLTDVRLSFNKISIINIGAFAPSVTRLDLDNNLLPAVPAFLSDLPNLQILNLQKNQITAVGARDFPVNPRITNLYLGENPLGSIDERAFLNFRSSLTYLNLENTWLTRLPLAFTVLTNLHTLWMPNNERLMCSCEEKAIAPWISNVQNLRVVGQCGYQDITEFVKMLAAHCP